MRRWTECAIAADALPSRRDTGSGQAPGDQGCACQWVFAAVVPWTRLTDSARIIYPPGGGLKAGRVARQCAALQGGTANNLIVAMKDFLVIFDRPKANCNRAGPSLRRSEISGKHDPLSRAHASPYDHTGGMRTYVRKARPIVVPSQSRTISRKSSGRRTPLVPDALARNRALR